MANRPPSEEQFYKQLHQADELVNTRQYQKALAMYEESLNLAGRAKMMLPVKDVLVIWKNISTCHFQLNNYDRTLQYCQGVIAITTEWIEANTAGKDTDAELRKNKSVPAWEGLLPDGVVFAISQQFDALPYLADSLAVAGGAAAFGERPDEALAYYKRAVSVFMRMNQPGHVARLWGHIASIHAQRAAWDDAITAANRGLKLSQQLEVESLQLMCGRVLVTVAIERGEYREAVRMLTHLIPLGRQARDEAVKNDLEKLQWLFDTMRKQAEHTHDVDILKVMILAERRLKHPDLEKDERLLAQLAKQAAQPTSGKQDGSLQSLRAVSAVVEQFAQKHCGVQVRNAPNWSIGVEELDEFEKKDGQLVKHNLPGVMLYLSKSPETLVRVTLTNEGCKISLMYEVKVEYQPGKFQMALKGEKPVVTTPRADALMQGLEGLVRQGKLVRQGNRLVYRGQ